MPEKYQGKEVEDPNSPSNRDRNNIRPLNQAGTLYHLINGLVLAGLLPWQAVAPALAYTVASLPEHGALKTARESAGVFEFPRGIKFLEKFAPRK